MNVARLEGERVKCGLTELLERLPALTIAHHAISLPQALEPARVLPTANLVLLCRGTRVAPRSLLDRHAGEQTDVHDTIRSFNAHHGPPSVCVRTSPRRI